MTDLLFLVLSAVTLVSAVLVVVNRNAVNAAMFFLLSLVGTAGLFVLLDAYLLAFVLILVYAGAVVSLFLFIIMLLDTRPEAQKPFKKMTVAASLLGGLLLFTGVLSLVLRFTPAPVGADPALAPVGASLKAYAEQLFTTYLLPVQVVGFLLLVAMLGVIVLSKRFQEPESRSQNSGGTA
ncbi:MAG: NADH-quinone oxidoreductase subunit J [Opitutae bacterium]|nr:NADH-quinone oxidoreductase subunit J [Opitutae bacterium]